jgi:hypothetical protein
MQEFHPVDPRNPVILSKKLLRADSRDSRSCETALTGRLETWLFSRQARLQGWNALRHFIAKKRRIGRGSARIQRINADQENRSV